MIEFFARHPTAANLLMILMIAVGLLALVANSICLALIARHRKGEIHMRASWIFSRNDVLANLGVVIAGATVAYFQSYVPDLLIGAIISVLVISGGMRIIRETRQERTG